MAPRSFAKQDARAALRRTSTPVGQFSPGRRVWTPDSMSRYVQAIIYEIEQRAPAPGYEDIQDVILSLATGKTRKPLRLMLTNLRLDELDVLHEVFEEAFDRARPLIEERSRRDSIRYANGGEPPASAYREVPRVIRREELTPEAERALLFYGTDAQVDVPDDPPEDE